MPRPGDITEFRRHAEWALIAATAHELGLAEALAQGPATTKELAGRLDFSARGVGILLGALEPLGVVRREGERFHLTAEGRAAFTDPASPEFQGAALRQWRNNTRLWMEHLEDSVRTGRPHREPKAPGTDSTDAKALSRFMAAMNSKPPAQVEAVVESCLERVPEARRVLDLGGGPGTFARGFVRRGLSATVYDRPEVIDHVADNYGLRSMPEISLLRGDFLQERPAGEFDIVLLANITHIYDPETNLQLLRDLRPNVSPGGIIAVLDFVRGHSEFAPLFAITMLLNTERGNTYSLADYRTWLEEAGYRDVLPSAVDADRQLITAER